VARFLVDESLPRRATRELTNAGHDATDVRDVGLRGASDEAVLARAVAEDRIVASADLDFANALRFPPSSHRGVVVLRLPDEWGPLQRTRRLLEGLQELGPDRFAGTIIIIEPSRLRLFHPPD